MERKENTVKFRRTDKVENLKKNEQTQTESEPLAIVNEEKTTPATNAASYELKVSDFKLYPNPTAGQIAISFKVETKGTIHIRLLDTSGKLVIEDEVDIQDGIFNKEYSIEGKSRGTYLLQIKQGDQWRHEKVVLK